MNPLDWSLIAGPLPVILLVSALLAVAWLVAGRNAPRRCAASVRGGTRGGSADGAVSVRWLAICVPLIVMAAGGVIALLTWLINNVWRPFPDSLPFTIVLWSWVALVGMVLALARQLMLRTWPRRAAAIAAGVLVLAAAANQVNGYFQAYPSLRVVLAPWLDPKPLFTRTVNVAEVVAKPGRALASSLASAARNAEDRRRVQSEHSRDQVWVRGPAGLHLPAARLSGHAPASASGAGAARRAAGGPACVARLWSDRGDNGRFREAPQRPRPGRRHAR